MANPVSSMPAIAIMKPAESDAAVTIPSVVMIATAQMIETVIRSMAAIIWPASREGTTIGVPVVLQKFGRIFLTCDNAGFLRSGRSSCGRFVRAAPTPPRRSPE